MTNIAEETIFIKQAIDALISTSEEISVVNPTIRELLERMQFSGKKSSLSSNQSASKNDIHRAPSFSSSHSLGMSRNYSEEKFIIPNHTVVDPIGYGSISSSVSSPSLINDNISGASSVMAIGTSFPSLDTTPSTMSHAKNEQDPEERFPCPRCELVFLRSSDLRRHGKAHVLTLPYICSRCGKGFARKDALKRHSNTLTCERNRKKLHQIAGDNFEEIIAKAQRDGISI